MMRSVLSRVPWVSCQKFATVDARDCDFAGQGIARLRLRSTLTGESDLRLFSAVRLCRALTLRLDFVVSHYMAKGALLLMHV